MLLVATATQWLGAARMPRWLARAGFDVSVLIPKGSLAEKSRFVSRIGYLPHNATSREWVYAFAATVKARQPRLVLPCDDTALRLLMLLATSPPPDMQAQLKVELGVLIADSLGDPRFYRTSIDKTMISPAAEAMGIPVPPHLLASDMKVAEPFIAAHGFPIVVKRSQSTAGDGVAICQDRDALGAAFARLAAPAALDFGDSATGKVVLQAHVPGRVHFYMGSAWKGGCLPEWQWKSSRASPWVRPAYRATSGRSRCTISRRGSRGALRSPASSRRSTVHERTGEPVLLELNRRMSHGTHIGGTFGLDFASTLHSAMNGTGATIRAELDDGEEHFRAHFPAEWIRDADSRWLRDVQVDIPWDEPELLQALVERGRGQLRQEG